MQETFFLTKLILNISFVFGEICIYSTSLHQDLNQNVFKYITKYIPKHIIQDIFNEEYLDLIIEEINNHKNCEKSETEIETNEWKKKEVKKPRESDSDHSNKIVWDDMNEK